MTIPQRDNFVSSRRRFLQRACAFAGMTAVSPAWAQSLLFIVPLAPGGGLDFIARTIGNYLSSDMGQQIIIKNRSGAGGTIGIDAAAQASPDGYTVLVTNDNIASTPHLLPVAADYSTAFASVIEIARQPQILAVHPSLGVTSLAGLIQLAKRRADLTYATSGAGSNQNILGEWFKRVAGIKLQHVPYRGAGQAIDDVVAGRVPIAILGPTALIPYYESGTLRLLAQSSQARSPSLPNIPTFQEAGLLEVALDAWYGMFVPVGSPQAVIDRLNAEVNKAIADPTIRKNLLRTASEPVGGTPEQLQRLFQQDYEKYGRLVKELGIKAAEN